MLAVDAEIDAGKNPLPEHMGGTLHGFVERAVMQHASHLMPVLRPNGDDEFASLVIEPPPFGQPINELLRFGIVLFRDATQGWSVIARALLEQAASRINNRSTRIQQVLMIQPGSLAQAVVRHGRLVDPVPWPESPAAWIRRTAIQTGSNLSAHRIHRLELRSPLLIGARGSIRREQRVPWPTLKNLLDSSAKRMLALEPELAHTIGIAHGWSAHSALESVTPLTPADAPARQIQWPYAPQRGIYKPGIVGTLIYHAELSPTECALLEWGQWLGLGQQTTMGCGRYIYKPG